MPKPMDQDQLASSSVDPSRSRRPVTLAEALAKPSQEEWTGFVVLKSMERRSAKNGTSFFRTTFADNTTAVRLYERGGFTRDHADVLYGQPVPAEGGIA